MKDLEDYFKKEEALNLIQFFVVLCLLSLIIYCAINF